MNKKLTNLVVSVYGYSLAFLGFVAGMEYARRQFEKGLRKATTTRKLSPEEAVWCEAEFVRKEMPHKEVSLADEVKKAGLAGQLKCFVN